MTYYNRRLFMKASAAGFLGATGALSGLNQKQAFAANTNGYKAIVGIFLKGGMDMLDAVLPYDQVSYDRLVSLRPGIINAHSNETSRALSNLLPLSLVNSEAFGGRQFALAPELASIHPLFESGEAAIVGNVGPLIEHTNRRAMENGTSELPANLFSHNDQQSTWMAFGVEGVREGWGGRFADQILGQVNKPQFTTLTAGSQDVFSSGARARTFRIPSDLSSLEIDVLTQQWKTSGGHGEEARDLLEAFLMNSPDVSRNIFGRDIVASRGRGLTNMREFIDSFGGNVAMATAFPETRLGRQLHNIAVTIRNQSSLGNSRQIFYADMGGFDTHDNQSTALTSNSRDVFEAIAAFRDALIETGQWNDVAVFTMSDFGRTLGDNGDGTDHGWGSHHFVFGGSVQGNRIYGEMPELDPDGQSFTNHRAQLIPAIAVEQFASTFGRWFGLDNTELDRALPNLNRFDTPDLGFLGGATV